MICTCGKKAKSIERDKDGILRPFCQKCLDSIQEKTVVKKTKKDKKKTDDNKYQKSVKDENVVDGND